MAKKYLYCSKCKKYPDRIKEKYLEPIVEDREWNKETGCYELKETNFDGVEFEELCGECETKLEER